MQQHAGAKTNADSVSFGGACRLGKQHLFRFRCVQGQRAFSPVLWPHVAREKPLCPKSFSSQRAPSFHISKGNLRQLAFFKLLYTIPHLPPPPDGFYGVSEFADYASDF